MLNPTVMEIKLWDVFHTHQIGQTQSSILQDPAEVIEQQDFRQLWEQV